MAIFVSWLFPPVTRPQVETVNVPLVVAARVNHRSFLTELPQPVVAAWPCVPVVARVVSNGYTPGPPSTSGVLQSSCPGALPT